MSIYIHIYISMHLLVYPCISASPICLCISISYLLYIATYPVYQNIYHTPNILMCLQILPNIVTYPTVYSYTPMHQHISLFIPIYHHKCLYIHTHSHISYFVPICPGIGPHIHSFSLYPIYVQLYSNIQYKLKKYISCQI